MHAAWTSCLALCLPAALALQAQAPAAPPAKGKSPSAKVEPRPRSRSLKPVDINHATKEEISFMLGIDAALAAKVVANRPYKVKADLVTKNVFSLELYQKLRKQVAAR